MIAITALDENPEKACSKDMTPDHAKESMMIIDATSFLIFAMENIITAASKITKTMAISLLMANLPCL